MEQATNGSALAQLSEALAQTVADVGESVVRVEGRRRGNASGVVWREEGVVVTAHHAVQRDHDLRFGLPGGETVEAELVGRDPSTDLAVLRAADVRLRPPTWADVDSLRVGHLALSVGRHDENAQASLGIVSKMDGAWRTPAGGKVEAYVQTDIVVYPGFSGSALVTAEGHVAGVNTSGFLRRASLTMPVATLRRVVGTLLEHGRVRRGFIGVTAHPAKLPASVTEELGQRTGLLVLSVEEGSPAEEGGVLVGDLLVALDGGEVRHIDDLLLRLSEDRIGQAMPLRIVRGGEVEELTVNLRERG